MRNHVVHYVTRQYMKRNRKRTMTAFLGIVFMVLLMTCVFVGKDTAVSYMERLAASKDGKWHAIVYDATGEDLSELDGMKYVLDTAVSKRMGITAFELSANPEKPYLNIRAYSEKCFDWMNIELSEGRFPSATDEIILSESTRADGSDVKIGDEISAVYFNRSITGTAEGRETAFPFQGITVEYGETIEVSQDFPYYGENESFRENINYTGESQNYKVVGFMKAPNYESGGAACYEALTWISPEIAAADGGHFNVSMMLDLDNKIVTPVWELNKFSEEKEVAFNDYVLVFSGNSSDSVVNRIVRVMTIFFLAIIIVVSVILIYNLFNMSFEERSRYLGMLCSVGATGRQKRSSVYYEAFYLLLLALPTGFILGLAVVQGGMMLLRPFAESAVRIYGNVLSVPVTLNISPKGVVCVAVVSICTVFISAYLPARKISKIGPIECIRGNEKIREKPHQMDVRLIRQRGAEGMLAQNSLRVQRKKTRGIIRSSVVFMVIFIVTAFGVQNITRIISYRMTNDKGIVYETQGWEYALGTLNGDFSDYEKVKSRIAADEGVDSLREWSEGIFIGNVPNEIFSQEYWEALHKVFNLYYHRELTDEEFNEHFSAGSRVLNVLAVDEATFSQIMQKADVDEEIIKASEHPAIVVQDGEVSTSNWSVGGLEPEKYQFYQIGKMTDLEKGEVIPMEIYSPDKEQNVDFPLTVAGYANNAQLKDLVSFHTEQMWIIVQLSTGDAMNEILISTDEDAYNYHAMQRQLLIKLNGKDTGIIKQIQNMPSVNSGRYFFIQADYTKTLEDSLNAMVRILLYSFVLLASILCLLSLYNSIRGRILGKRQEFAIMKSMGATTGQIRKMLNYECQAFVLRSIVWAVVLATPLVLFIWKFLVDVFGYIKISFPWGIYVVVAAMAAMIIVLLTQSCFARMEKGNVAEDIREERG